MPFIRNNIHVNCPILITFRTMMMTMSLVMGADVIIIQFQLSNFFPPNQSRHEHFNEYVNNLYLGFNFLKLFIVFKFKFHKLNKILIKMKSTLTLSGYEAALAKYARPTGPPPPSYDLATATAPPAFVAPPSYQVSSCSTTI